MNHVTETRFVDGSFAPIAVASRNGVDESLHHGAGVVISSDGAIVCAVGDPELAVHPRSALKPFQANAMVRAGLDLPHHLLAVVVASHSGEACHLDAALEILRRHGLGVDDLDNTPALPFGRAARRDVLASGGTGSSLYQNCSGKHAGMLATCVINEWETHGYLDLAHPLQHAIHVEIDRLAGRPSGSISAVGVDGCGAPTHVMALIDVARALRTMVLERSDVVAAMRAAPIMVAGTGRDVTWWMEAERGLVAKEGADGVMVAATADGRAGAFKIADGSDVARRAVTTELLRRLGLDVDGVHRDLAARVTPTVLGHGATVGHVRALPWS